MDDNFVSFNEQDLKEIWLGCINNCDDFMRSFLVEAKPISFDNFCLKVEASPFLVRRFAEPKRQELLNSFVVRHTGIPNAAVKLVPRPDSTSETEEQTSVFPPVHINVAQANGGDSQQTSILSQFRPEATPAPMVSTDRGVTLPNTNGVKGTGNIGNNYDFNDTMLQSQMTFDTYVCGENNQLAVYTARRVAEQPGASLNLNPLYFYGGVGLGKTHLLNAIGNYIRVHFPEKRVYYISAEQFMNEYVNLVSNSKMDEFYKKYRNSIDTLLIDDIQFLENKEKTQEEFFHTFEYLRNNHKQIVIASDRPVDLLPKMTPRLQSRLKQGMVADIQAPKYETRIAILKQKALQSNYTISDDVLGFIADAIHANVRELEGALTRVWNFCAFRQQPVSLENAKEALKVELESNDSPSPEDIIKAVCNYFKLNREQLLGTKRNSHIVKPRKIAMYLMRTYSMLTLEAIGVIFNKNHSTVLHACQNVEDNINDTFIKNSLMNLRNELKIKI